MWIKAATEKPFDLFGVPISLIESWDVVIGFIVLVVGAIYVVPKLLYQHNEKLITKYKDNLKGPKYRQDRLVEFSTSRDGFTRYLTAIEGLNLKLEAFFGPSLGWKSFNKCLAFAFVYPMALFLLGWLFGASGKIGEIEVLADEPNALFRLIRLCVLCGYAVFIYFFLKHKWGEKFAKWSSDRLIRLFPPLHRFDTPLQILLFFIAVVVAVAVGGLSAVIVIVAGTGAVAVAIGGAGLGAGAGAVIVIVAVAGVVGRFGAVAIVVVVVVAVGVIVAVGGGGACAFAVAGAFSLSIFVFYLVLPLANGLMDFASWAATRGLLKWFHQDRRGAWGGVLVVFSLIIDIVLALICLIVLVFLMVFLIEAVNLFGAWRDWHLIDWRAMVDKAHKPPIGNGVMIFGMVFSTLIPTAIHLGVGVWGLFVAKIPHSQEAVGYLQDDAQFIVEPYQQDVVAKLLVARQNWLIPFIGVTLVVAIILTALLMGLAPFASCLMSVANFAATLF